MPCDFNVRGRSVDLPVQEQRYRALMAWVGCILVYQRMESGHGRHEVNQKQDTQAKKSSALFSGAHDPLDRGWHHGPQYAAEPAPLQSLFLTRIFWNVRLRKEWRISF